MRDEAYFLELCDEVLSLRSLRQHRFVFLRGDNDRSGRMGRPLPIDAFYPQLNLAIEYRERQHVEAVPFFDHRPTVSGISRGLQRAKYDERRRVVLHQKGIKLIEFNVAEFPHNHARRLRRIREEDIAIIRGKLAQYIGA